MVDFFQGLFGVLACAVAIVLASQFGGQGGMVPNSGPLVSAFLKLRNNYVLVFSLMMARAGDWLQGPYVYALYEFYGFSVKDIGRLFIAGFGSSMIFGTIVGSLADKHGRKKAALAYVVCYVLSCATKHSPDYWVLMFGRLLGGIATSLLFSAFESWLVAEHFGKGFDERWLGDTFSKAVFFGNGLVAILAGLLAEFLVGRMQLGPVAPFDASAAVLLVGGVVVLLTWGENYGDSKNQHSLGTQFQMAIAAIMTDRRIALLGAMQSLFEASMYSFVFLWTPALSPHGEKIPHGLIFACFMTASMVGSALSSTLMRRGRVEAYMKYVFGLAAITMLVPFLAHTVLQSADDAEAAEATGEPPLGLSLLGQIQLIAFCCFEVLVGVFWPSMMTMRAHYIPEELRSTIINCFRVPLNIFVCIILYNVSLFPLSAMFALCSVFLAIATLAQIQLERVSPATTARPESEALLGGEQQKGNGGGSNGGGSNGGGGSSSKV